MTFRSFFRSTALAGAAALVLAGLAACATAPLRLINDAPPLRATADPGIVATRQKLAEGARQLVGRRQVVVRGRTFTPDCTGLVLGIYWYAGIDLGKDFSKYAGGGVTRLYRTLQADGLLYTTSRPLVGDIIFWDNTYDENNDLLWDDPLSHTGMVTAVDQDGTISYIHYHVTRGVVVEKMNLDDPATQSRSENGRMKLINSPLRLAVPGLPHPPLWLAGQLFRNLGLGYLLR
jgi:peptidoglycan DL-endopeptidase CwlO